MGINATEKTCPIVYDGTGAIAAPEWDWYQVRPSFGQDDVPLQLC